MKQRLILITTLTVVFALLGYLFSHFFLSEAARTKHEITVAFIGDQGLTPESQKVLELIKSENADLLMVQGDFDYEDNPEAWDNQFDTILGQNFPVLSTVGNHDVAKWPEYQQKIIEQLNASKKLTCEGDIGVTSVCTYKNLKFISVAPGIFEHDQTMYAEYLASNLSETEDVWNICLWHKNQKLMQTGDKQNETGWEVYEACGAYGAMIVTGHEHAYSRTHLLSDFPMQRIASASSTLHLEPGQSFAVVSGLGGKEAREQKRSAPWFASVFTKNQGATAGALFCTFNTRNDMKKAKCYFKDINGAIPDTFELTRN
jgi:hypothetical protein